MIQTQVVQPLSPLLREDKMPWEGSIDLCVGLLRLPYQSITDRVISAAEIIFSQLRRLEVQDLSVSRVGLF